MSHSERSIGRCEGVLVGMCAGLRGRLVFVLSMPVVLVVLVFVVGVSSARAAGGCANEGIREEQGSAALALPECRGYELVTPVGVAPNVSGTNNPTVGDGYGAVEAQASSLGGAVAFVAYYSPEASPTMGQIFIARRGEAGWSTQSLMPALEGSEVKTGCVDKMYLSADLGGDILATQANTDNTSGCEEDEPPLVEGEPRGVGNLFVRMSGTKRYSLVNLTPSGVTPVEPLFGGSSSDLSRVVFEESAPLTLGALSGGADNLYEWHEGVVSLVSYLPDGITVSGALVDQIYLDTTFATSEVMDSHEVSSDGEYVFFEAEGALYVRENAAREASAVSGSAVNGSQCLDPGEACTVQLDASHVGGSSGGGLFLWASDDGERVFFSDVNRLTPGATAETGKPDLYEYDLGTGELTDLTVDPSGGANVLGVLGASADGSYLYFVARGILTSGPNPENREPVKGKPNLYVRHGDVTSFIATLNNEDGGEWGVEVGADNTRFHEPLTSVVSPDGATLLFNSVEPLTGYENKPVQPEDCLSILGGKDDSNCNEIFRFDVYSGRLVCVSCGGPGSQPAGLAELRIPAGMYQQRSLASDGSVFFDTPSSLLSQDSNGVSDVYEWSPVGVGECSEESATLSPESDGCLYSISSGASPEPSYFADASDSGEDLFFVTTQSLVAGDTDNALSLYDARVGGGYRGGGAPREMVSCKEEEECKPAFGEAPVISAPAPVVMTGPGNLVVSRHEQSVGTVGKRTLTRAQRLAKALRACAKEPRRRRASCRATAKRRYGVKSKVKAKKSERGGMGR